MNIEDYTNYCLNLAGAEETFPFDNVTLVVKVYGKMFALFNVDKFESINLKSDPEKAIELRERYDGINPGWHMSKVHWNTITVNSDVDDSMLLDLTKDSYDLVISSLPKKVKENLLKY